MNDEQLFARLASHDGPAALDGAFEDRLYSILEREMRGGRSLRPALLLAATLALMLTIIVAIAVGSGLIKVPWVDRSLTPQPSATGSASPGPSPIIPSAGIWTATGSMVANRSGHAATLLPDGRVLVIGGGSGGKTLASAELYDPASQTWTTTGSMDSSRSGHTATPLLDGRVLVAGGRIAASVPPSTELYDPASGTWTATGSMDAHRSGHTATLLLDGRVLVVGGRNGEGDVASAELFDPATGSWTATASMDAARRGHTATLLPDGRVLVAGGFSGETAVASAELYNPVSGSWTPTGGMDGRHTYHTATLLPDGRVLVAGIGDGPANAELYDPSTGSWTATGNMLTARFYHTASLLLDGTVLLAGGEMFRANFYVPLADAELYNPSTGSWTATRSMLDVHDGHTATVLADGSVLVVGGSPSGGDEAGAELYGLSVRGWPGPAENPPGQYSWVAGLRFMHNGYQTLDEGQEVSITVAYSSDADEAGPTAVTIAGYPGTYQERISTDGARTRRWIVEIEGRRVTINVEAEANTTAAQLAEVDAIIESIRYAPTDNFRLIFTLPAGWDSG